MKYIIFTFFITLCYLSYYVGKATEINILTYTFDNIDASSSIKEQFSEYARRKNLNITVNVELIKFENPTDSDVNYKSLVESSLIKSNNKKKYEIYFYNLRFIDIYGPYLLDLKELLPKEHIEKYNPKVISDTCYYNDQLVGLPHCVSYEILYSNMMLLNKYGRSIPKIWSELIDTCKWKEKQKVLN